MLKENFYNTVKNIYGDLRAEEAVSVISNEIVRLTSKDHKVERPDPREAGIIAALLRANTEFIQNIRLDEISPNMKEMLSGNFISNLEGLKRCLGLMVPPGSA